MKKHTLLHILVVSSLALGGCVGEEVPPTGDSLDVPAASKAGHKSAAEDPAKGIQDPAKAKQIKELREKMMAEREKSAIPAPSDVAAAPEDATVSGTGLASKVLKAGTGAEHPSATDTVNVHYTGWTTDGKMFDSSVARGEPISFPLNRVIPGWTEGVQLMVVGESRRLWIPEELAYKGRPGAPQGMLVFDVELLDIVKPPQAPEDVAAIPKGAEITGTGLGSKVLKAGEGEAKPTASSRVMVHYSGWTTDGNLFDSSVTRGQPATFPLNGVIAGWTEGLQLMKKGEKRRFWIPEDLAYKGSPGKPQGMLVFDVELLDFK